MNTESKNAANARLIAVAPEMYELIQELVRDDCEDQETFAAIIRSKAKDIIKKAGAG